MSRARIENVLGAGSLSRASNVVDSRMNGSILAAGFVLAIVTFATGLLFVDPYIALVGIIVQYVVNVAFSLKHLRSQIIFLFLHLGIFLFWLTRPIIGCFYGTTAWFGSSTATTFFSLVLVFETLVFLLTGGCVYLLRHRTSDGCGRKTLIKNVREPARPAGLEGNGQPWCRSQGASAFVGALATASLLAFLVCACFSALEGFQMLSYMDGRRYEDLYVAGSSAYTSSTVSSIAGMLPYALCVYLATMPKRTSATLLLLANVALTLPSLMVGTRTDFVLAALFLVFYYVFRTLVSRDQKWITKRMVIGVLIMLPIGVALLGAMNYARAINALGPDGFVMQIADALYKQGVTFKVLQYAYDVNDAVQSLGPKFFAIGSLIDSIEQGFIGQQFLGVEALPSTNSMELALYGNSYGHTMSYFAHYHYLQGEAYGSSFALEPFADGGLLAVALYMALLAYFFSFLSSRLGEGWFVTFVALMAGKIVFYIPRSTAVDWISYIWSTRFWLFMAVLLAVAYLFVMVRRTRVPASSSHPARSTCLMTVLPKERMIND